jgi:hypothetical protein
MNFDPADTESLLRGRRILVVGRDYYFSTREIVSELRDTFGAAATFRPIEPRSFLYRLMKKVGLPLNWWLRWYHRNVIRSVGGEPPEIVLFIQVHQIGDIVREYREAFRSARFVLYYWDSIKTHDYRAFAKYFDKVFTFDRLDAAELPGVDYLPLFFSDRFRRLRQDREIVYDMSFVGVAVTARRYDQLVTLRVWAKANGVRLFDYIVVSPILYIKLILRGKLLRGVHFRSLDVQALLRIYAGSRSVLDLPNNVQSGYTMRTFESLGAHRKLVTASRTIVNEDFYTPESVFVIGANGELPDRTFLDSQPNFSPAVERYLLRTWILRLLCPVLPHSHDPYRSIIGPR